MAVKAPPPTISVAPYNWSGLYVGGNFGGAWTSGSLNIPGNNFYGGLTEFIGGVQAARQKKRAGQIARVLKRTEGAVRQHAFEMGLSLDSRV